MAERHWTEEQLALMRWLCLPPQLRKHKTITELATYLGYDRDTLYLWMSYPSWEEAKAKMAIQVQLELDADFRRAQTINMIDPEKGDKERIAYYRYQFKPMLELAASGALNEIRELPATDVNQVNVLQAQERLKALPPAQQYEFLNILQELGVVAADNALVKTTKEYSVKDVDDGEPKQTVGSPQYSSYNRVPKRRRYAPTPKTEPDNSD